MKKLLFFFCFGLLSCLCQAVTVYYSAIRHVHPNAPTEQLGFVVYSSYPAWSPIHVLSRDSDGGYVSEQFIGSFEDIVDPSEYGNFYPDTSTAPGSFPPIVTGGHPPFEPMPPPLAPETPKPPEYFPWEITYVDPPAEDITEIVQGLNTIETTLQNETTSQDRRITELKALLGAAGNSWIYDCKMSLASLESLVRALHLEPPVVNVEPPVVNVAPPDVIVEPPVVNVSLEGVEMGLTQVDGSIRDLGDTVRDLGDRITSVYEGTLPDVSLALDLGDGPRIPHELDDIESKGLQAFGVLSGWGDNGAYDGIDFNPLNGLLTRLVGSIPSVGTDATMFTVAFTVPYMGSINHTFSFSDYPACSLLREVLLFALYLFFGLACFKLVMFTLN